MNCSLRRLSFWLAFVLLASACQDEAGPEPRDGSPGPQDASVADASEPPRDAGDVLDAAPEDACASCADAATPPGARDAGGLADAADAAAPPIQVDLRFEGQFPLEAFAHGSTFVVLLERPLHLGTEYGLPARSVRWIRQDGSVIRSRGSSGMRYLLDVAVHPSGQATLLFAAKEGFSLERTNAAGDLLGTFSLVDPAIDTDLPAFPPPDGPIPKSTYDVGRLAAAGERVILATRTGRHSVITYGLTYEGGDRFAQSFRTLVAPPLSMPAIGLIGGTYDTFGLVGAQYAVHLAVGPDGLIYLGVRHPRVSPRSYLRAHEQAFGEKLVGDPDGLDSYVTRLSAEGVRLGTTVVTIPAPNEDGEPIDELQSLHAVAGAVWLAGRTELWNAQGTGHDLLLARIDGGSGAVQTFRLDVDRGDIAFGLAPADEGRLLVVGASGYTQNPQGASVSEASQGFARFWSPASAGGEAWLVPNGPRHNETRFVLRLPSGQFLLGGMLDGPGTHSADGDLSKLRADGYLVTRP